MIALIFSQPFIVLAQQDSVEIQAKTDAKRDAETDVNKLFWTGAGLVYLCGCLCLTLDNILSGGSSPSSSLKDPIDFMPITPRPKRLIGKSPEYVGFYTKSYKMEVKELRAKWALIGAGTGCLIGCIMAVVISDE